MNTIKLFVFATTFGKIIALILIMAIPYAVEVSTETYYEIKKAKSINHFWSAFLRVVLMAGLSLIVWILDWTYTPFEPFILSVSIHFAFFNYTYNFITREHTGRKWNYLRDAGIDKALQSVPIGMLLFAQGFLLAFSIFICVHGLENAFHGIYY